MCGRARQVLDWQEIKIRWWADQPRLTLEPRWNAAPRQKLVVVRQCSAGDGAEALPMVWGFVPAWEKDLKTARRPINAMAETIATSALWRDAFKRRRCIFPVAGFYEWKRDGKTKQPHSIDRRDGEVMALAAVWDRWKDRETGDELLTFAVVTCPPNELVAEIHDRMPVVLDPASYDIWLDGAPEAALPLLKPCPADDLVAYRVSDRVGNVRNDGPDVLERIIEAV